MSGQGEGELDDMDTEWLDAQLQHTVWSERKATRRARRRAAAARVWWWVKPGQVMDR
jgi:hypothetical protein